MTAGVLVVGYGNSLRSDDGLGWHIAGRLAEDPRLDGVAVLQRHELMPELALDFSRVGLVVLVDASHTPAPGTFSIDRVEPAEGSGMTWSHHLSPSSLLALARELYGEAPEVVAVSVGVESFEVGDRLSPLVEEALPRVADAIVALIAERDDA